MASRPLPPGRLGNDARSPVRPNVALRWTSNVAATPPAPKDALSPVKRWPPVKAQVPLQPPGVVTLTSKAVLQPAVEENRAVSAFQSARAVFEAKKTTAVSPPPPPPTRHRFAFPIEKQHSTTSDLSASSCSTLDSESDRKLEESVAVNYEPEPSSPVHAVVKKMEVELAGATPSERIVRTASPFLVNCVIPSPSKVAQAPPPRENAATLSPPQQIANGASNHSEIDPFRLLLPIESVPRLPDDVICLYDRAAIEMEKNIKKVVRKLLKKDRVRLEEFKVNSRLFGTDFLDSSAYLDTLIKDFGSIRALHLVPCLLSIQPNLVKSKALLLTAKNYLLRNKDEMKRELQRVQLLSSKKIATVNANPDNEVIPATVAACDGTSTEAASIASTKTTLSANDVVYPTSGHAVSDLVQLGTAFSKTASPVIQPPALTVVPALMTEPVQQKVNEEVVTKANTVEPMPESQVMKHAETPPPLLNIAVSTPSRIPTTAPIVQKNTSTPVPTRSAELETPIKTEEGCKPADLFGETFRPISQKKQKSLQAGIPAASTSPASSVHSFDEAESLFGERLSPSSRTSTTRRKSVTWGDTQTMEVPDKVSVIKTVKKPAPLLFGLATAAAFESDEDESDLSD